LRKSPQRAPFGGKARRSVCEVRLPARTGKKRLRKVTFCVYVRGLSPLKDLEQNLKWNRGLGRLHGTMSRGGGFSISRSFSNSSSLKGDFF